MASGKRVRSGSAVASELEDRLVFAVRAVGLPEPERDYQFASPRRWRFDLAWPEYKLACEVEGGHWGQQCRECGAYKVGGRHVRGRGYEADCEKYSEAVIRGWGVLRVTGDMVEDGRALMLISRAFGLEA